MKNCSIILPVLSDNGRAGECLARIAKNTELQDVEIIVSANPEPGAFPEDFLQGLALPELSVTRARTRKTCAQLCNQGAEQATGRFLAFLSENILLRPGWLDALLADFAEFPELSGTGPILVSETASYLGPYVQSAGLAVDPFGRIANLYHGVPQASPLAKKRRFFQAVLAACLVLPAKRFRKKGGFDSSLPFHSLAIPFGQPGKSSFSLNPAVKAVYREQLPDFASELPSSLLRGLRQDWTGLLERDGLMPSFNPWLMLQPALPGKMPHLPTRTDLKILASILIDRPFWEKGWAAILSQTDDSKRKAALCQQFLLLFPNPSTSLLGFALAAAKADPDLLKTAKRIIDSAFFPPVHFREMAQNMLAACKRQGLSSLSAQLEKWLGDFAQFSERVWLPFARDWFSLAARAGMRMDYRNLNIWEIWREAAIKPASQDDPAIAFSILMPVYNPDPAYLRKAIESALGQSWPHWELCIADDASTDPRIRPILEEYAQKDKRVRIIFRERNGQISEATNSALSLAANPWIAFMDQDDLLAPEALAVMAEAIARNPQAKFLFSDEDHIDEAGRHFSPHFKNGKWDRELLAGQNFVCHLMVCHSERLRLSGGLRSGFPGAQDHDLVMRFTEGLSEKEIVHVPAILYHWRAHAGSTASSTASKPYVRESAVKACQEWLNRRGMQAVARNIGKSSWMRVHHAPPDPRPMASIIKTCATGELAEAVRVISANAVWPHELLLVDGGDCPVRLPSNARMLETGGACPESLNRAAAAAAGDFLVFLGPSILPESEDWLAELASVLYRQGVGCVGGKARLADNALLNGGYLADATGCLKPLFSKAQGAYYGWNILARTVDALDGACLAVRKKIFLDAGGLDPAMGEWAFQDLCLRLQPLASIWQPFSMFLAREPENKAAPQPFREKWDGKLAPFNKNVLITSEGFSLAPPVGQC